MPYLNLDINYFTNVKTRRLVCLLGPGSELLPIRLWCHCASHHAEDGVLEGYSVEEIEFFLEWKGPRGKAVSTLLKVGFLDPVDYGFRVHDWMVHEGHISEFKRRSRIANASRWKNSIALADARSRPISKNSETPCTETRTPSRTPSNETRTLNLSNHTTQRQTGDVCAREPEAARIKDGIRETILQRMGPGTDLSEEDVETMVALSKMHGLAFQKACEHLRPGVENIVGYVRTLLDLPKVPRFRSTSARLVSSS
jgi:hypothetical protein